MTAYDCSIDLAEPWTKHLRTTQGSQLISPRARIEEAQELRQVAANGP